MKTTMGWIATQRDPRGLGRVGSRSQALWIEVAAEVS